MKHSVFLDKTKCRGCTTCVKACPTEAIRVKRGKAVILDDHCIDCGICVSVCPHHAKQILSDGFEKLRQYEYNVALPAPPLFGQFRNLTDMNIVLEGLLAIGFDDVYEVSRAAEMLSDYRSRKGKENPVPRITSSCPATLRLIAMRFPELLPNVITEIAPFELAAILARREAFEKTGLPPGDIGICYISSCPAENTRSQNPIGFSKPVVDYVVPVNEVYLRLLEPMRNVKNPRNLSKAGQTGLDWSRTGGQCPNQEKSLGVDGLDNVIRILEDIEDGRMIEADFVQADACTQSCFGGCLNIENPYTAKLRMRGIVDPLPKQSSYLDHGDQELIPWQIPMDASNVNMFAKDMQTALAIQAEAERIFASLPKFDCGSCGAPGCSAFAEDVALGHASIDDCIYNLIKKMRNKSYEEEVDEFLPPPFRRPEAKK